MRGLVKFIKKIIFLCVLIIAIIIGWIVYDGYKLYEEVTYKESIEQKVESIVNSENYLSFDKIPQDFIVALVSVEDHRFFEHSGFDVISIGRAFVTNIQKKELVEGGSSITQQLAKNMYFEFNKDFTRKVAELFVSLDLEEKYEKEEILAMYINIIYFGEGYYGLNEAANGYYGKEVFELTYDEITLLAGLPNAPSVFNPIENAELARQRQNLVKEAVERYNIKLKK